MILGEGKRLELVAKRQEFASLPAKGGEDEHAKSPREAFFLAPVAMDEVLLPVCNLAGRLSSFSSLFFFLPPFRNPGTKVMHNYNTRRLLYVENRNHKLHPV